MQLGTTVLFIVLLLSIFYQDLKERKVTVLLLILTGFVGGYLHFIKQFLEVFLVYILLNMSFIILVLLVLFVYVKIKMRRKFIEVIGLGDILFFILLGVSFPTVAFLVLFSSSLLFSLVLFLFLKPKLEKETVPLAGLQAVFLVLVLVTNTLFNFINIYQM